MKKNSIPPGAALIFTMFAVIMLASFAVLALSTANADLAMTNRAEKAMSEYYALDMQAQKRLMQAQNDVEFEIKGETMTLYVAMSEGKIVKYHAAPNHTGDYGENILELWDGK